MMTSNPPLLRLLADERRADEARFARLQEIARMCRPGYPQLEAFAKNEVFSPQKAIRELKQANDQLRMPDTQALVAQLYLFMTNIERKLQTEQDKARAAIKVK